MKELQKLKLILDNLSSIDQNQKRSLDKKIYEYIKTKQSRQMKVTKKSAYALCVLIIITVSSISLANGNINIFSKDGKTKISAQQIQSNDFSTKTEIFGDSLLIYDKAISIDSASLQRLVSLVNEGETLTIRKIVGKPLIIVSKKNQIEYIDEYNEFYKTIEKMNIANVCSKEINGKWFFQKGFIEYKAFKVTKELNDTRLLECNHLLKELNINSRPFINLTKSEKSTEPFCYTIFYNTNTYNIEFTIDLDVFVDYIYYNKEKVYKQDINENQVLFIEEKESLFKRAVFILTVEGKDFQCTIKTAEDVSNEEILEFINSIN